MFYLLLTCTRYLVAHAVPFFSLYLGCAWLYVSCICFQIECSSYLLSFQVPMLTLTSLTARSLDVNKGEDRKNEFIIVVNKVYKKETPIIGFHL